MHIKQILWYFWIYYSLKLGQTFMEKDLIISFFRKKQLGQNVIITCSTNKAQVELSKALMQQKTFLLHTTHIKRLSTVTRVSSSNKRMGVVLDGDCLQAKKFILKTHRYNVFDSLHSWLVLQTSTDPKKLFKYANLNINSEVKVATSHNATRILFYDVYNPAYEKGGELKVFKCGFFEKGKVYTEDGNYGGKYEGRRNLSGVQFKAVVVLPEPFEGSLNQYLKSDRDVHVNTFNRFHSRLMSFCAQYYNFSMKISVDHSWGYIQSDGSVDGLVGDLAQKKVDFGLSPLFVGRERLNLISYGRKTWSLRAAFVFRNPKSRKSYQIFVKPLSLEVWVCIVGSSVLSVYTQRLGYQLDKRMKDFASRKVVDNSWGFSAICTFGAFCQQGIISFPNSLSGRTSAYVTLLLGLLTYQFYSASLVSFLLNVPTMVITSVQSILDNGYNIGCEDVLYNKDFLKHSTDSVVKEVLRRLSVPSGRNATGFLKPEVGLDLVRIDHYAFHVELATGYPIIEKQFDESTVCELKEVPMFPVKMMHANYQKWSPFKDMLDVCLQRLGENGVMNREIHFWHPRKPECVRSARTININTGLEDFYPALCVLLFGVIASLIILGVEILYSQRERIRKYFEVKVATLPFTN